MYILFLRYVSFQTSVMVYVTISMNVQCIWQRRNRVNQFGISEWKFYSLVATGRVAVIKECINSF